MDSIGPETFISYRLYQVRHTRIALKKVIPIAAEPLLIPYVHFSQLNHKQNGEKLAAIRKLVCFSYKASFRLAITTVHIISLFDRSEPKEVQACYP